MLETLQQYHSSKNNKINQSAFVRLALKTFKDDEFLSEMGIEFHSLGAVIENERSYKEVRDLGTARVLLTDDLRWRS